MDTVDVLLTGKLLPGSDENRAADALARMTGLPQDKALALLTGGKPKLAKRGLSLEDAQVFVDRFTELGIETALRPGSERVTKLVAVPPPPSPSEAQPAPEPPPTEPEAAASTAVPDDRAADDAAMSVAAETAPAPAGNAAAEPAEPFNPYAPPKADLTRPPRHDGEGRWSDEPAEAPVMRGLEWFHEAWTLFRMRPKIWLGPLAAVALLYFIVLLLPRGSGSVALSLILPVLAGGVAVTAHRLVEAEAAREGEDTPVETRGVNPFADARAARALINIALCCVLYQTLAGMLLAGLFLALGAPGALLGLLVVCLLVSIPLLAPLYPISMFGPSLVTLGGLGAIAAIKTALRGGLKNWQPLVLNALVMAIAIMLGLGLAMVAAGHAGAVVVSLLCTVVFAPLWGLFALTSYFAAREVFYEEDH